MTSRIAEYIQTATIAQPTIRTRNGNESRTLRIGNRIKGAAILCAQRSAL
jgi:hypothetical protein